MDRHTGLDKLWIDDLVAVSWPSPTISDAAMILDWAFNLKHCHVGVGGLSAEAWFMDLWHSRLVTVDREADGKRESTFTLTFLEPGSRYISGAKFML